MTMDKTPAGETWENFNQTISSELEHSKRAYKEVALMLEQSQAELVKMTQRSASISAHLQQIQAQFDSIPRADIRMAYNSMLDAQQRLLVMRGQIEKLQNDQDNLQRMINFLEQVRNFMADGGASGPAGNGHGGQAILEKMVNSQEAERLKLSRQMHDGPAQALSNFVVQTEIVSRLFEMDPNRAKEELENLKNSAMSTFQKVRLFITNLRPMMLDDLGMVPTVKRYVDSFKDETGCETTITVKGTERRLEPYVEVMIFRAVQELMGNAYRHNQDAASNPQIGVQLTLDDDLIKVVVSDNGKGFHPDDLKNTSGLGLKIIQERVEVLGGSVDIDALPGQGARISLQIPVETTLNGK